MENEDASSRSNLETFRVAFNTWSIFSRFLAAEFFCCWNIFVSTGRDRLVSPLSKM
jgi:hypothetical protein